MDRRFRRVSRPRGVNRDSSRPAAAGLPEGCEDFSHLGILVVDDDENCLESLEDVLVGDGHVVRTATRGDEAVRLARRCQRENLDLQLSILDFNIIDLTGIEVYEQLSRELPGLGAIFISGETCEALESRVLSAGGFALVRKPLDVARVRETVQAYQGWRSSRNWR